MIPARYSFPRTAKDLSDRARHRVRLRRWVDQQVEALETRWAANREVYWAKRDAERSAS